MRIFGICLRHHWTRWLRRNVKHGVADASQGVMNTVDSDVMVRICRKCLKTEMKRVDEK